VKGKKGGGGDENGFDGLAAEKNGDEDKSQERCFGSSRKRRRGTMEKNRTKRKEIEVSEECKAQRGDEALQVQARGTVEKRKVTSDPQRRGAGSRLAADRMKRSASGQ